MIIPKSTILREAPHQIYLKILNMLYLLINYYLEGKNPNISAFQFKNFLISLYRALHVKEIN